MGSISDSLQAKRKRRAANPANPANLIEDTGVRLCESPANPANPTETWDEFSDPEREESQRLARLANRSHEVSPNESGTLAGLSTLARVDPENDPAPGDWASQRIGEVMQRLNRSPAWARGLIPLDEWQEAVMQAWKQGDREKFLRVLQDWEQAETRRAEDFVASCQSSLPQKSLSSASAPPQNDPEPEPNLMPELVTWPKDLRNEYLELVARYYGEGLVRETAVARAWAETKEKMNHTH